MHVLGVVAPVRPVVGRLYQSLIFEIRATDTDLDGVAIWVQALGFEIEEKPVHFQYPQEIELTIWPSSI